MLKNKDQLKELYKAKPELIQEHKRLVEILRSGTEEEQRKEAEKQLKELKEMLGEKEVIKFAKNGQWFLEKSNYGPKGMGLYSDVDNIKRKQTRTGEEVEGVGRNKAVRQYTSASMGTANQQAAAQAKQDQKKSSKNPVRTLKDMSDEEIAAISAKYNTNKADDTKLKISDKPLKEAISDIKNKYAQPKIKDDATKVKSIKNKYANYIN